MGIAARKKSVKERPVLEEFCRRHTCDTCDIKSISSRHMKLGNSAQSRDDIEICQAFGLRAYKMA